MPPQTMEEVKSSLELSQQEAKTLHRCELVIESGLKTFHQVGQALLTVREGRLYRAEYKSFEDYCDKRWSMSRNYGTRLMSAAETFANLENSVPIGTVLPKAESQTRPLSQLPAEEQGEAWAEVQKRAEESNKPITAAAVQAVVAERLPTPAPKPTFNLAHRAEALVRALGSDHYWEKLRDGAIDLDIKEMLRQQWAGNPAHFGPGRLGYQTRGGVDPQITFGNGQELPFPSVVRGKALMQLVRDVMGIPPPAARTLIIDIPPVEPEPTKPEPASSPLDYVGVNLMQNAFIDALDGDDPVPSYPNATLDYWAHKIRTLRDRVRELEEEMEIGLVPTQSVSNLSLSVAITPGLRLQSRKVPEHTYTIKNKEPDGAFLVTDDQDGLGFTATETEIWKNFEVHQAAPSPFLTRDGQAQHVDAGSRLECVKKFDLPQLRAALLVPKLQGTVRFAVEKRIKKLEAVNG